MGAFQAAVRLTPKSELKGEVRGSEGGSKAASKDVLSAIDDDRCGWSCSLWGLRFFWLAFSE